jgi:hypothetical protein
MIPLRWETESEGRSCIAYSGKLDIGSVVKVSAGDNAGMWKYTLDAVHTRHICKGRGHVKTEEQAKQSLERAWSQWLDAASLVPWQPIP